MNSNKNYDYGNYKRAMECLQELPTAFIRRLIKSDEILTTQGKKALHDTLRERRRGKVECKRNVDTNKTA